MNTRDNSVLAFGFIYLLGKQYQAIHLVSLWILNDRSKGEFIVTQFLSFLESNASLLCLTLNSLTTVVVAARIIIKYQQYTKESPVRKWERVARD